MLKRISALLIVAFCALGISGCGASREKLLILNWGEYINEDIITQFEELYNVDVIMDVGDSNEYFYSRVKAGTTVYDLVVPSDYMIEKMVEKDLLQKINFELLENYSEDIFMEGVKGIMGEMFEGNEEYHVPYFWGTFGLMYNKRVPGLETAVKDNGWAAFFEEDKTPAGTRVGMYDVPRYAYATSMFYLDKSPNEISADLLSMSEDVLSMRAFDEWSNDNLKKGVKKGTLDLAFVYTGDFLDMLYMKLDSIANPGVEEDPEYADDSSEIMFDIYVPDDTIAFLDSLVIPKKARHVELAHKFIDYLLNPEIMYQNASVVGYCTPLNESYNMIINPDLDDEELTPADRSWLINWKNAMAKYYPLPLATDEKKYKGVPLSNFDREYLDQINTMVNNVIASA